MALAIPGKNSRPLRVRRIGRTDEEKWDIIMGRVGDFVRGRVEDFAEKLVDDMKDFMKYEITKQFKIDDDERWFDQLNLRSYFEDSYRKHNKEAYKDYGYDRKLLSEAELCETVRGMTDEEIVRAMAKLKAEAGFEFPGLPDIEDDPEDEIDWEVDTDSDCSDGWNGWDGWDKEPCDIETEELTGIDIENDPWGEVLKRAGYK